MASVQASPGKENLSGAVDLLKHKPIDTTIEIKQEPIGQNIVLIVKQEPVDSELIAEPLTEDDLGKNMRWIMERAEKFEGNEPAGMFDALGAAGPVVRALKKNLSIAYTLLKENDMQVANGTVNPIAGLQKAYSITSAAERLVKTTSAMLKKITAACTVTATFEELAAPLADFVDYLAKLKDHKFSTNDLIELVCQLLKKMQDSSSGPHDSSLLSATERLFIACFNSPNSKLRTGAVSMWNKTFGNSKDLVYSDKLRQVLVVISKRASIFLPGLSVELKAEKSNASTPHKIRLTTKRPVAALVEEDSVDYHVPAQKTDLTKKMKLTDHQKECFSVTREKMPYMDEDSSQFKTNVLQRIGSQYDVDTSSQSASTSAIQKVAVSAQATEAVFKSPVKKESPVKIEISNVSKEPEEKKNEEKPKKRRGRPPKNSGKAEEKSPASSNSTDGKRRSARRNLVLSPAEKKKDADENSAEIVTRSSDSTFESSDNSQDASSVAGGRSRRSQNKGTPSKFVPKVRYSRDRAASTVKSKSPSTKKAEPSPAKDSERNNNADAYLKTETDEEDNETLSEIIAKSQKKMPSKTPTNSDKDPSTASSSIRELPPVENSLLTPTKNNQSEEKVDPPITTPGILKRAGTPSTLDKKKMRVHFTQDVALREEERNAAVTTPKRGSKKIDAFLLRNTHTSAPPAPVSTSSHAAVFPTLANDTEPITKILDQLTPVKTSTSAAVLRKSLTLKNITTVGDLAATSESGLRGLPIKLDRVKCVLQKYAQIVSKEMPPVEEEKKVEAPPVTIAPTPQILSSPSAVSRAVHDDDSMETEELKTIEFSPGKVVEKKKEKGVGIDEEQSLKENKEPEAARVETKKNVEEREKIAGSQDQMLSMLSSLTRNSSLVGQMNLGRDQVKELLTAVNSLQTCLLQKL